MSVESTTTITGLNALWPLGSDSKSEGDDHLRLIKSVLKTEFSSGGVKKTSEARNRVINGAMQISQENGNTAGGPISTPAYFAADQWQMMGGSLAPATVTGQRVQVVTPNGSKDRFRVTVNVADAGAPTTDYLCIRQSIEGIRLADFRYGLASAKQAVLRFGWKSPAGTWSVSVRNSAANRSWVGLFTVTAGQANTDTEQVLVIPGDVTGTWLTDSGIGAQLDFFLVSGSSYQGVTGWQAGAIFGTSTNTNGVATAGNVFELFDVGLYLDANNTGLAPPWTMPDEAQELAACMRYWQVINHSQTAFSTTSGTAYSYTASFPVPFRVIPAVATTVAGTLAGGAAASLTASTVNGLYSMNTNSAGVTFSVTGRVYSLNARM